MAASCLEACGVTVGRNLLSNAAAAAAGALLGCLLTVAEPMAAGFGRCTALQQPAEQRMCSAGSAAVRLLDPTLSWPDCGVTSVMSMLLQ